MKNTVLILMMVMAIATGYSCKKKKSDPPATPPQNFQPTSAGSTWTYNSVSTSATRNYTLTATGNDSTINGNVYKIFTNSGGPNEYYRKAGNDYFRYSYFEGLNQALEFLYLKENYNVNDKWEENKTATINGVTGTAILECVVTEKGINYTVNGKTFTGVTHIKINPKFSVSGFLLTNKKAEIHYYFANNVGFIYSSTDLILGIPLSSDYTFTGTVTLTAYNIK